VSILTNTTKGRVKDMWEQVYIQKVKNEWLTMNKEYIFWTRNKQVTCTNKGGVDDILQTIRVAVAYTSHLLALETADK
jgi:hypothetical protein